jgi:hypothetical protein
MLASFLDFLVNEVTKDGTVIHLTDVTRPESAQPAEQPVETKVEPAEIKARAALCRTCALLSSPADVARRS